MDGVRVLVVEDERLLADAIAEGLRREALAVDVAYDGDAALERLGVNDYDVVVLDRDLPVVHGDDVCRAVVDSGGARPGCSCSPRPARSATGSPGWPWAPTTTWPSRSRSSSWSPGCARWAGGPGRPRRRCWSRAGIALDPARREVFRDGRHVPLSRKEFARAGRAAAGRRRGGLRRAAAGEGRGTSTSTRSPTCVRVTDDEAAPQARRPAGDRDRAGSGVPDPMSRLGRSGPG